MNDESIYTHRHARSALEELCFMAEDKAGDPDCPAGADEWFATEQDLVRQWAGERGTLFTRREFLYGLKEAGLGEPLEGGNEHDIIPPIEGGFWFLKITNTPGGYGAGVQEDCSGCLQDRRDCKTYLVGKKKTCVHG